MSKNVTFKQSQRFRVISGDVSFYATKKEIRRGVGDFIKFNLAMNQALDALENYRQGTGVESSCQGLAGTWQDLQIQLNVA